MPRLPLPTQQALRLATAQSSSQYICHSCRAHALRSFSTTVPLAAEQPFWKRLQESVFGSKGSEEQAAKRDQLNATRAREQSADKPGEYVDAKGRVWEKAAIVDPSVNSNYQPASDWNGLERIGGAQWMRERGDGGEVYRGFGPRRRLELRAPEEWRCVVHHVTVEVLALYQAGRDVNEVCRSFDGVEQWQATQGVVLGDAGGLVKLVFPEGVSEASLLKAIPTGVVAEEAAPEEAATAEESVVEDDVAGEAGNAAANAALLDAEEKQTMRDIRLAIHKTLQRPSGEWLRLPLADPSIKLAILKRIHQLTGVRLPDPIISSASTLADLYTAYKIKPAPKKLAKTPELQGLNSATPNITVHGKRQSPLQKEQQVGRWKVIEEELTRRGLPVTGSRWQGAKLKSPMPYAN